MKKLILSILLIIISVLGFAQTFPIITPIGSKPTMLNNQGTFKAPGYTYASFTDTTEANASSYLKFTPGIIILTGYTNLWVRNSAATAWVQISGSGGGGTLTSLGGGIAVGITGSNNTNSLAAGYGQLISAPAANLITFSSDTATLGPYFRSTVAQRFGKSGEDVSAAANRAFTWGANTMTETWSALGANTGMTLNSSGTASGNTNTIFRINQTGSTGISQTTYGAWIENTRTGTGGASTALRIKASGKSANSYAIVIDSGWVGIGTLFPVGPLYVRVNGLAETNIYYNGISSANETASTSSIDQFSPNITWIGSRWNSAAGGASEAVTMASYLTTHKDSSGILEFNATVGVAEADVFGIGTSGEIFLGDPLNPGTSGQILKSNGRGSAASWVDQSSIIGATPTWDATLAAGSTITTSRAVLLGANNFQWSGNSTNLWGISAVGEIYLSANTMTMPDVPSVKSTDTSGIKPMVISNAGTVGVFSSWAKMFSFSGAGSGTVTSVSFTGGLISVANPTTTPAFTVAGTSGGIPYFSSTSTWASSALLSANALMIGGGAGTAPATTTTGTGVLTALGINVGSAGAFVTFNGALGTPSSGTLTNATGYLWNNIASPTGTQTLSWPDASLNVWTNGSNTETFTAITSNSLTTGIVLSMTSNSQTYGNFENYNSTSTAKVTGNALSVHTSSGANATASVTNLGDSINITNTGTTATNIAMKLGASGAPTANIALQTFAGNVLIGAPTNNTVDGLIIQSPTNTAGQGLRVYANNNSTYIELGYGAILNPGGFAIQSSSATIINLVGSTTYIGAATTATSTLGTLSFAPGYVAKTANYSATISDFTIEVTANSPTITLPTAVGITGRIYYIVNSGAGTVTIATTSSQVFQNVTATPTTLSMATVGATGVQSNGANWLRLSSL